LQTDGVRVSGFTTTLGTKAGLIEDLSLALEMSNIQLLGSEVGKAELEAYEYSTTEGGLHEVWSAAGDA